MFFSKKKPLPLPAPFTAADIRVERSTCTGETTIGFFDRGTNRLMYAELVRTPEDIRRFYARYGLPAQEQ